MGYEHVLLEAKEFFHAYLILEENNERIRLEIAKSNPFSVSPTAMKRLKSGELKRTSGPNVVCLAFSLELYLKGLIIKLTGNSPKKKHSLVDLFVLLPGKNKTSIIHNTEKYLGESFSEHSFMANITAISNAFVEWRYYLHEKGTASFLPKFGVSFARAISNEAEI
jgi:HEPN domain-containing protein